MNNTNLIAVILFSIIAFPSNADVKTKVSVRVIARTPTG